MKPLLESAAGRGGMPPEILRALLGGVLRVIHKRLYLGQQEDLVELGPKLWQWFFSYPPPPGPLRVDQPPSRRTRSFEVRQESSSPQIQGRAQGVGAPGGDLRPCPEQDSNLRPTL